ncbi:MAG: HEAT repeat domain-containing protein [Candidatus Bathyarchaeota archaeon]|nr:HEAT repeat domain-containing protein [Candidatus Bathyarchaeota archaeon]MDH5686524.1 HEAT repeat domain-containing protein [Candidatus Bathyarchaeota archaeon]
MEREEIIDVLAKYRRPGTPVYDYHFRNLPSAVLEEENVPELICILEDKNLPSIVREHAAGALGEIGDKRAVKPLIEALKERRLHRGVSVALGRMKAEEAMDALQELAPRSTAARWALSQLSLGETVEEVMDNLRYGPLWAIPKKMNSLSDPLRKEVQEEIVRQFREVLSREDMHNPDNRDEDWRLYVTALSTFQHHDAPKLLAETLERAWRQMGSLVGLRTKQTCCGCLHNRTLRALKTNPSLDAVPNLVETITNRYQRHALMALKRLRELNGGGLTDVQIAKMVDSNTALSKPIVSKTQRTQIIKQVISFAGDYGGAECRRTLKNLRSRQASEPLARTLRAAIRQIDARHT